MYLIRLATDTDIPSLTQFFERVYHSGHIIAHAEYLKWQYQQIPGNPYFPHYSNLLLLNGDTIVGHLGLIPQMLTNKEGKKKGAYLSSLVVDAQLRAHGAGAMLVREAEKYYEVLYTTGFNNQVVPVFRYCSWAAEQIMTRWVYLKQETIAPNISKPVFEIARFDDAWDTFWRKHRASMGITIDRTSDYLNWRFFEHPRVKYHVYGTHVGGALNYIILRIEQGEEYVAGRIIDMIASDESATSLLSAAVRVAIAQGAEFVDYFSYPKIYAEAFQKVGFYEYNPSINPHPPMLILPVDKKRLSLNFSYKYLATTNIETMLDWYVTKSDGDRDRAY